MLESFFSVGRFLGYFFFRQGFLGSLGSFSSQYGSLSKLFLRVFLKFEGFFILFGKENQQVFIQGECFSVVIFVELSSDCYRCLFILIDCFEVLQSLGRIQYLSIFEISSIFKLEIFGRYLDVFVIVIDVVSLEVFFLFIIEEKVMLCIQENVEKG